MKTLVASLFFLTSFAHADLVPHIYSSIHGEAAKRTFQAISEYGYGGSASTNLNDHPRQRVRESATCPGVKLVDGFSQEFDARAVCIDRGEEKRWYQQRFKCVLDRYTNARTGWNYFRSAVSDLVVSSKCFE